MNDQRRKILAVIGSLIFLMIAPLTVVGLIPYRITRWHMESSYGTFTLMRAVGVLLIVVGVSVLLDSFARFATQGIGTPAPISPRATWLSKGSIASCVTLCTSCCYW